MTKRIVSLVFALMLGLVPASARDAGTDWNASWISKEYCQYTPNTWLGFRTHKTIEAVPQSVVARIAADSKYWLWINGELVVREGGLKRGPEPGDGYYDRVEIAPYLKSGDNVIAVLVWHFGRAGFSHQNSGTAAMLFEAVGDGVEILSDSSWECDVMREFGSCQDQPNYRLPESSIRYDARISHGEWYAGGGPKYLGHCIEIGVAPGQAPLGKLIERPIPQWKDYGLTAYESSVEADGMIVCNLPYNCHVAPYIRLEAPAGKVIRMETDHYRIAGKGSDSVIAEYVTVDGVQEFECFGWINGEKVIYTVPEGVKVLDLKYRQTGYDAEFSGWFHCDDEFLNDYWQKAARTLYVCMRDTYYDCPDRERAQWWGDEVNELGEAFYVLSRSADKLALKGIYELVGWQRADGVMHAPVPASNYYKELPMQILASVGWYGFHNYWFYSGDDSFVADVYPAVHKYLHETWKVDDRGLPIYREGDWDWPDAGDNCDKYALLGPWYYLALKGEKTFADMLGLKADSDEIAGMMSKIEENYNDTFWKGNEYRSDGYTGATDDRVHAMAVVSGLAGSDKYEAISKVLLEEYHATTYMQRYVLEALFMMGEPERALIRMHRLYPTVMKEDCSTLWEHWNYDGTSNHAWTGGAVIELGRKVAGIEPLEPGFRKFCLDPQMGYLKEVDAKVDTNYGLIEVSLRRKGRRVEVALVVPEGTEAVVEPVAGKVVTLAPGSHQLRLTR